MTKNNSAKYSINDDEYGEHELKFAFKPAKFITSSDLIWIYQGL